MPPPKSSTLPAARSAISASSDPSAVSTASLDADPAPLRPAVPADVAPPPSFVPPPDLLDVASRAADMVMERLAPDLAGLKTMLAQAIEAAPARAVASAPEVGAGATLVEAGTVDDADIDYLAASLSEAQFDRIVGLRRGSADLAYWTSLGAIPGKHLVARHGIKMMVAGKGKDVAEDTVLLIADLDPIEMAALRAKGHLVAPGEAPAARR